MIDSRLIHEIISEHVDEFADCDSSTTESIADAATDEIYDLIRVELQRCEDEKEEIVEFLNRTEDPDTKESDNDYL